MILLYFLLFYILGIVLWVTRKYDFFTIALTFIISAVFLGFGNLEMFIYILCFFCVAEGVTLILNRYSKRHKKHSKRSYKNLLGNCLAGSVFMVLGHPVAAIASICASFCDTMSSEVGMLSSGKPKLITTFKTVDKGTDGGITFLGYFAAFMVCVCTIAYFYFFPAIINSSFIYTTKFFIIILVCGMLGTTIDSLIGALLEIKGYSDNYQTNFLSSAFAGVIALLLIHLL
jgi:uncharacterized protein (TIGR00297 family)